VPPSYALLADLQSVHGLRCYDNTARTRYVSECLYSLMCLVYVLNRISSRILSYIGRFSTSLPRDFTTILRILLLLLLHGSDQFENIHAEVDI